MIFMNPDQIFVGFFFGGGGECAPKSEASKNFGEGARGRVPHAPPGPAMVISCFKINSLTWKIHDINF